MITKKDNQFMQLCESAANIFSTCGKRKYSSILVVSNNHIVGFGYNGGPRGFVHCQDGGCDRLKQNSASGSSYENCIAIHAEANAFLHSDYNSNPEKIYVNGPPCFSCAKLIANSTVKTVYYKEDVSYLDWNNVENFLNKANIKTIRVK